MIKEVCPSCQTPVVVCPSIGPYCPNDQCWRIDDLRPYSTIESVEEEKAQMLSRLREQRPKDHQFIPDADGGFQVDSCIDCGKSRREHEQPSSKQMVDDLRVMAGRLSPDFPRQHLAWSAADELNRMRTALERAAAIHPHGGTYFHGCAGCIAREAMRGAVETAACLHDMQKPDHTLVLTHDLREGHEYDSTARCKICGQQWMHPLHAQL